MQDGGSIHSYQEKELRLSSPEVDVMIIIFCDFYQFSAKKLGFFSKTNVMITFLQKLAVV
jgi:hypothetical protein